MGRVIVITAAILILGIGALLLTAWITRSYAKERAAEKGLPIKGDLNRSQEHDLMQRLDQGVELVNSLLTSSDWMNGTILADADRSVLTAWVTDTKQYLKEGLK